MKKNDNPALKEAAKEFNGSLLDEQAKKIEQLKNLCNEQAKLLRERGKEISRLNGIIHKKNKLVSDKDAVLSDVAEELRLSKIREENLTEVCKKYLKEIDELKEKLEKYAAKINHRDVLIENLEKKLANVKEPKRGDKSHVICLACPELIIPHGDFMEIIKMF